MGTPWAFVLLEVTDDAPVGAGIQANMGSIARESKGEPPILFKSRQPRTSQTTINPKIAEPTPIRRRFASGASVTAATAFLACVGKAAKTMPSITKTRPTATRKSVMRRSSRQRAGAGAAPVVGGFAPLSVPLGLLK